MLSDSGWRILDLVILENQTANGFFWNKNGAPIPHDVENVVSSSFHFWKVCPINGSPVSSINLKNKQIIKKKKRERAYHAWHQRNLRLHKEKQVNCIVFGFVLVSWKSLLDFIFSSFYLRSASNRLGSEGAKQLSDCLKSNTSLTSLDLGFQLIFLFFFKKTGRKN